MMKNLRAFTTGVVGVVATLSLLSLVPNVSSAADAPGVQVVVKKSVDDTISQLSKMVADNGMMVMGELHQGKVLKMTGLKVKSESIFVGNPTVGKKLFSLNRGAGLAVPMRINVFENEKGQTVVCYIKPSAVLGEYHNPKIDKVATMLDGKLEGMTSMLAN